MGVRRKIVKRESKEVTVKEVFALFRAEKKMLGRAEKTLVNYEESLKRFLQELQWEDCRIQELDKLDIMEFVEQLQEQQVRTETINHYLRDLRSFLNWCSRE